MDLTVTGPDMDHLIQISTYRNEITIYMIDIILTFMTYVLVFRTIFRSIWQLCKISGPIFSYSKGTHMNLYYRLIQC